MSLGVLDHTIDFVVRKRGGAGDGDLLLLASALVLSGDLHDAVGIDVKGDLDLRHAAAGSGDTGELELTKRLVVASKLALALQDVDLDAGLVIGGSGVDLGLRGRDSGVAVDHLGHDAAHGLDAQRQRGNVEQQDALDVAGEHAALDGSAVGNDLVGHDAAHGLDAQRQRGHVEQQDALNVAGENTALNSSAVGNDLVRVHGHVGLLAGHGLDQILDGGHTGGAADEDDLGQIGELELSVAQGVGDRLLAALEQVAGDLLELSAGQRVVEVQRAGLVHGDERQVDGGLLGSGELLLGVLGSLLQTLQGHGILTQVNAVLLLELVGHPVDDTLIPIVAAQVVIARGG
ncbi:uncharacterized protein BN589_01453 [Collinsella sp. CAG:289]|nr:uncharacterized protein BN589_01453 [Collinsella sp. CAG:289]